MQKKKISWLLGGAFMTLSATTAIAAPSLEGQVQILIRQNQEQSRLIKELQEQMQALSSGTETVTVEAVPPQETSPPTELIQQINDHVQLSGLIEVEASSGGDYDGNDSSDITLATVEIGLNAQISTLVSSHITLLYEEGEEDDHLIVDEGTITIGNLEKYPIYASAGKMYVPFGHFDSNMISDPLTLEIGETGDTGLLIGFERGSFYGAGYGFNGDIKESGDDDSINTFGLQAGYFFTSDRLTLNLGMSYLSNIGDTDSLSDALNGRAIPVPDEIDDAIEGVAAHGYLGLGSFTLIAEYLGALDDFSATEIGFKGQGAQPKAYNLEVAFVTELFNRPTTFAVGYQATEEALALELPESRYIGAVSMEVLPYTALSLEYFHDKDYAIDDGGTDNNSNTVTMQIGLEF